MRTADRRRSIRRLTSIGALGIAGIAIGTVVWLVASGRIGLETPSLPPSDPAILGVVPAMTTAELLVRAQRDGNVIATVPAGQNVAIIEAAGSEGWVRLQLDLQLPGTDVESTFGWARTNQLRRMDADPCQHGEEGWVTLAVDPPLQRSCAQGQELRLEGFLVGQSADACQIGRVYRGEPMWLAQHPCLTLATAVGPALTAAAIGIHLHPDVDVGIVGIGPVHVSVVGHFDDPASAGCRRTPLDPRAPTLLAGEAELWCAQQFVVTSIRVAPSERAGTEETGGRGDLR